MAFVRAVLFTPDGKQLITAGDDKAIRVWDLPSGRTTRILRGEISEGAAGKLYALAISPDGRWLAAAGRMQEARSGNHPIRLYDLATGEMAALLEGHVGAVLSLAFSADGRWLASGSSDKTAIIWDLAKRSRAQHLKGHLADINRVAFTLDGERLASASDDRSVIIWRIREGRLLARSTLFRGKVFGLAVSPVTGEIAASTQEGEIALLDDRTAKVNRSMFSKGAEFPSLSFSPDGRSLLAGAGAAPYHCLVFDVERAQASFIYRGHQHLVAATAISPDGRLAVTAGGRNNEVHVWELATGRLVKSLEGTGAAVVGVGFAADGQEVAFGQTGRFRSIHDRGPLEFVLSLATAKARNGSPERSEDHAKNFLRSQTTLGQLRLAARVGGKFGYEADLDILSQSKRIATIRRDETSGFVHNAFTFAPDGRTVISGGGNGALSAYALDGSLLRPDFIGHFGDVWAVAVSPDGRILLSGADDQTMRLWNLATRELIASLFYGREGEWVMWTPQGYYASSPLGDALVGWHINRGADRAADFVTARQLRQHFFRPDIVDAAVRLASAKEAIRLAGALPFRLAELSARFPPELTVLSPASGSAHTSGRAVITLAVSDDTRDPIDGYAITVGDRRVPATRVDPDRAREEAVASKMRVRDRIAFEVPLAQGSNVVRLSARNSVGESQPIELVLDQHGEGALDIRGTLYIIAVGVDHYVAGGGMIPNLEFASADAKSFEAEIRRRFAPQHKDVRSQLLVTGSGGSLEPSRANVTEALKLLRQAGANDTVVVFLAGHGDNRKSDYYFLPADARLATESWIADSVVSWTNLLQALSQTDGRRFLFVDTCHSASAFNFRLMKDTADADIVAYSATNREQSALELRQLGHGVFTYALLEGLSGAADTNGDRVIRVFELGNFLAERVLALTKGEQTPDFYRRVGSANLVLVRL